MGELHRSGITSVYLVDDLRTGRRVVVKVLCRSLAADERYQRRFLSECRVVRSLHHPHIIPIHRVGTADGLPYAVMPYVDGGDLRGLLDVGGPLPLNRTVRLIHQIADALDHVHQHGLVHRDVKPDNILLTAGPAPHGYLADFGIAMRARHAAAAPAHNLFVGSFGFSAPEQAAGLPVDHRADIYSLGCVLYACLTAATPWREGGLPAPAGIGPVEPPPGVTTLRPDLPQGVERVVRAAMASRPDARPDSCGELARAFARVAAAGGRRDPDRPDGHPTRPGPVTP